LCPYSWCKFKTLKEPRARFRYNGFVTNQKLKGMNQWLKYILHWKTMF